MRVRVRMRVTVRVRVRVHGGLELEDLCRDPAQVEARLGGSGDP